MYVLKYWVCIFVCVIVCYVCTCVMNVRMYIYIYIYGVSQEECARLREGVPYAKL